MTEKTFDLEKALNRIEAILERAFPVPAKMQTEVLVPDFKPSVIEVARWDDVKPTERVHERVNLFEQVNSSFKRQKDASVKRRLEQKGEEVNV